MVGDPGEVTQGAVDVLRAGANPLVPVAGQGPRIEGDVELPLVGGADDPVPLDPAAQEHDRPDGPVVLAVAGVVAGGPAHLALDDDDQAVANLQVFGPTQEVPDAGEELGDE